MINSHQQISATEADWNREKFTKWWSPSKQLLKSIRQYQKWQSKTHPLSQIFQKWYVWQHRFWSVVTGADIPVNCNLGGGLKLTHPNGVVINSTATIGVNCLIFQQVTITKKVQIGGHVDIGAGAKILSGVKIGNHAKIGANAVVVSDVPEGATAVGIPARIINKKSKITKSP